jgi:hypothetical protein
MGWLRDIIKCLSACSIRLKVKCKSSCCQSDCMLEETPERLSKQESGNSLDSKKRESSKISSV